MRRHGPRRALLAAALVTVLGLVTTGCDWIGYRNGAARTGANLTEDGAADAISVNNAASLRVVQTISVPGLTGHPFSSLTAPPIEGAGKTWINGGNGVLHVLDKRSGVQVATIGLDSDFAVPATPTLSGGQVFVTRQSLSPASNAKLFAIDANTLQVQWTVTLPGLGTANDGSPLVADGSVFVNVGQKIRQFTLAGAFVRDIDAPGNVSTPPVAQNGVLFFGAANGRVTAVRISDGARLWSKPCPDTCAATLGIAAAGDKIIVSRDGGRLRALSAATGDVLWTAKGPNGNPVDTETAPAVAYGKVYIGSGNGGIKIFDLNTGAFVAGNTDGHPSDVTVANGVLFTANPLRAYRADNAVALANTHFQGNANNEAVVSNGRVLQMANNGTLIVFDA